MTDLQRVRQDDLKSSFSRNSLIVCTRNRSAQLAEFLSRIKGVDFGVDWELIVVNNDSTDSTASILNQFISETSIPVRVVFEKHHGSGIAKNSGLEIAEGELVVFTDDDCYPEPDYLQAWREVFTDESISFAGGRIELYDPLDLPITIQPLQKEVWIKPYEFLEPGFINGANMAFRRVELVDAGGFDPLTGAGTPFACEDVEAMLRICFRGKYGKYSPIPLVYHHHGRKTLEDREKIIRYYSIGWGAYFAKIMINKRMRSALWREVARRMYRSSRPIIQYRLLGAAWYCYALLSKRDSTA